MPSITEHHQLDTSKTATERIPEAAGLAMEAADIGRRARAKEQATNAADTAAALAGQGSAVWSAERLNRAAFWAASTAATATRWEGDKADLAASLVADALAHGNGLSGLASGYCPCGQTATAIAGLVDDYGDVVGYRYPRCRRHRGATFIRVPLAHVDRQGLPSVSDVNSKWMLERAKRRCLEGHTEASSVTGIADLKPGTKTRRFMGVSRSSLAVADVATAVAESQGKTTVTKRVHVFLTWAMQDTAATASGRGTGKRQTAAAATLAEVALAEAGWTPATAKGEAKLARKELRAILPDRDAIVALVALAEGRHLAAMADADRTTRALLWYRAAAAGMSHRPQRCTEPSRRYEGLNLDALWGLKARTASLARMARCPMQTEGHRSPVFRPFYGPLLATGMDRAVEALGIRRAAWQRVAAMDTVPTLEVPPRFKLAAGTVPSAKTGYSGGAHDPATLARLTENRAAHLIGLANLRRNVRTVAKNTGKLTTLTTEA